MTRCASAAVRSARVAPATRRPAATPQGAQQRRCRQALVPRCVISQFKQALANAMAALYARFPARARSSVTPSPRRRRWNRFRMPRVGLCDHALAFRGSMSTCAAMRCAVTTLLGVTHHDSGEFLRGRVHPVGHDGHRIGRLRLGTDRPVDDGSIPQRRPRVTVMPQPVELIVETHAGGRSVRVRGSLRDQPDGRARRCICGSRRPQVSGPDVRADSCYCDGPVR